MKSSYRARNGHERYRACKKYRSASFQSRRKRALEDLEEDLKTGKLRVAGERTDTPLDETKRKRIIKEISNIKEKLA